MGKKCGVHRTPSNSREKLIGHARPSPRTEPGPIIQVKDWHAQSKNQIRGLIRTRQSKIPYIQLRSFIRVMAPNTSHLCHASEILSSTEIKPAVSSQQKISARWAVLRCLSPTHVALSQKLTAFRVERYSSRTAPSAEFRVAIESLLPHNCVRAISFKPKNRYSHVESRSAVTPRSP